jgi:Zn finger protein HypA/HybF involved in hydrogenase expression
VKTVVLGTKEMKFAVIFLWRFSIHQKEKVEIMTKYLICKCGWKSEPYADNTEFMGLGGILSCPECTKFKRNPTLCEGQYGHVHSIIVNESYNPSKRENIPDDEEKG